MTSRFSLVPLALMLFVACPYPAASGAGELPRVLIQRGERFLAMGKYPAAQANYAKVIACCEGSVEAAEAHNDLGVLHARQGHMDLAVQEYRAALSATPYPLAHFNLGKTLAQQYRESGDDTVRQEAVSHLSAFAEYLHAGSALPPVVTYQRKEIEAFVARTLQEIETSK